VLVSAGHTSQARALVAGTLPDAQRQGVPFRVAHGLRAAAAVASEREREALLRDALTTVDRTPWRIEWMEAGVALGAHLAATGRRGEAVALLRAVTSEAHLLGASRLSQLALGALRCAGARPRRLEESGVASLTPAERAVVSLVASGMSNPDIARRRGVTTKAVEHLLTSAYRKLGVRSRIELLMRRSELLGVDAGSEAR